MKNKKNIWIIAGLLLIAAALCLTGYNLIEQARAQKLSAQAVESIKELMPKSDSAEVPSYALNPDMEMPVKNIDGTDYIGILQIPSLELDLPVAESWSYPLLRKSPCRYVGSAYKNNLVIAAHNYNSHFGRIKSLCPGDEVVFTDMDSNVFRYRVEEIETLAPTDVEQMKNSDCDLTLFTCTVGGRTRVTVRCTLIEERQY